MKDPQNNLRTAAFFLAVITVLIFMSSGNVLSQAKYKTPPPDVVKIVDEPWSPLVRFDPDSEKMALVIFDLYPPISFTAQPFHRLAGIRINPDTNSRRKRFIYRKIQVRKPGEPGGVVLDIPRGASISMPYWSHDGKYIAFSRYLDDRTVLVIADAKTGKTKTLDGVGLSYTLDPPIQWAQDNRHVLIKMVPKDRGPVPEKPRTPHGPVIRETSGKYSQMRTYQDLLKNPYDDRLFEYYCTSQLAFVNVETMEVKPIGKPALYKESKISPDGKYMLVQTLQKPYSRQVPYYYFPRTWKILDMKGNPVKTIARLPVSEEVPRHGVPTGPRYVSWQPLHDAKLVWAEALDGGDPTKDVPYHDRVMTLQAPFKDSPREVVKVKQRFAGFYWLDRKDEVMVNDYDRKKKWFTSVYYDIKNTEKKKTVFSLSVQDAYNNPGEPVYRIHGNGVRTVLMDGDWFYLHGDGASPQGDRPFLDRMNIKTLKKERLYRCDRKSHEEFISFLGDFRRKIITRYQSLTEPPNYYIVDLDTKKKEKITHFKDPNPIMQKVKRRLIKFKRSDGLPMSGILYLPPGYKKGDRLPLIMWAYPREYASKKTAGQVRGSRFKFIRLWGSNYQFFLTQGYAVFRVSMPVVGDPDTVNNTFIKQIVSNAECAINKLNELGYIDTNRVLIGGHSYGAFMTANLLAHCDLFAAGIARSGAYNRTLTPFGFQSERRTFWEAPEFYLKVSPFTYCNKIKEPILLIHGLVDSNSGTYPMQSKRMFAGIKGNGGTARLVLLPEEGHFYTARETNLHVLYEMFRWADKYVKNRKNKDKKVKK